MRQIEFRIAGSTTLVEVAEHSPDGLPVLIEIRLIERETARILSQAVRVVEVHGGYIIVN